MLEQLDGSTETAGWIRSFEDRSAAREAARWCVFADGRLVVAGCDGAPHMPSTAELQRDASQPAEVLSLGSLDGVPVLAGELEAAQATRQLRTIDLRAALASLPPAEAAAAGYASQIVYWNRTTRFCPVCGARTRHGDIERVKVCDRCGHMQYPKVSPAIIVLVVRPGQMLLTRQASWPAGRYSLVAGFVEPGETLEACVRREVGEETGVALGRIRYLGSQPWPFPHQLMVGFVAEWRAGEIVVDTNELEHAAWFDLDKLPNFPPSISISRMILDWYIGSQADFDAPFADNNPRIHANGRE